MRGWIYGLVSWFLRGEEMYSSQALTQEIDLEMTGGEWTERQLEIINNLVPQGTSPRLRAYLESQLGTAEFTPWAVFRD